MSSQSQRTSYDPRSHSRLSFADRRRSFMEGSDTPRAFLERCIEMIEHREPEVKAFVSTHLPNARAAADASTSRDQPQFDAAINAAQLKK